MSEGVQEGVMLHMSSGVLCYTRQCGTYVVNGSVNECARTTDCQVVCGAITHVSVTNAFHPRSLAASD